MPLTPTHADFTTLNGLPELESVAYKELYLEMCHIAHLRMKKEREGHTLNTHGLVHEAFERLTMLNQTVFKDKAHYLAIAGIMIRQILLNYSRQKKRKKRGGGVQHVRFHEEMEGAPEITMDKYECLDEALCLLEAFNQRAYNVVIHHYFHGLTFDEIAKLFNLNIRTVFRDWKFARKWLQEQIKACT